MRKIVIVLFISISFYSCKKLNFENAEVKCFINGAEYFWKNKSTYGMSKHPIGTWASMTDTSMQFFFQRTVETKKGKEYKLRIDIHDFTGIGTYNKNVKVQCGVIDYGIEAGRGFGTGYDSISHARIVIFKIDSTSGIYPKVYGEFELELVETGSTVHQNHFPKILDFTQGVFEEVKIKEKDFLY